MIQRYDINWAMDVSEELEKNDNNGDVYKVSDVDPIIAKLEAENDKLREIVFKLYFEKIHGQLPAYKSECDTDFLNWLEQALKEE
jgi:hypothetical protein